VDRRDVVLHRVDGVGQDLVHVGQGSGRSATCYERGGHQQATEDDEEMSPTKHEDPPEVVPPRDSIASAGLAHAVGAESVEAPSLGARGFED
jgi:hypothetical protein